MKAYCWINYRESDMRFLVLGGTGFIGSHIVDFLVSEGHEVRVVDNLSTGKIENLDSVINQITFIKGNITDSALMAKALDCVDYVFHLAAFISVPLSMENPEKCFEDNITGTTQLLEASRKAGVKKVVLTSSAAVYGDAVKMPLTELSETTSLSPYAASKRTNEVVAELYSRAFDLPTVCLRYFNVFGPRQSPKSFYAAVVPIFIEKQIKNESLIVHGDGGQTRDFVFVKDIVRANWAAMHCDDANGQVFNICSGKQTSLLDLIDALDEVQANDSRPVFSESRIGDIYHSYGDPSKAKKLMGYVTKTDLADGLEITMDWMRHQ